MNYRVIVEPTAERGIRESYEWLANHLSPDAATRWYNALEKSILSLAKLPLRYPIAAENDSFPEEIREMLHGKRPHVYRILYTIRQDAVSVLSVRHAARDEIRDESDRE